MSAPAFELADLDISLVDQGFIVGVSPVGTTVGAESAYRLDVTDQLTRLDITQPRRVDDDLFIFQDTPTLNMTAILEDAPAVFRGRVVVVQLNGEGELFRGRVVAATRTVQVDTTTPGARKWSVAITATTAQERHAGYRITAPDAPAADPVTAILQRLPYISQVYVHPDVDVTGVTIAAGHDDAMSGLELLTRISRVLSCLITTDPAQASRLLLLPYDHGATWTLRDDDFPSYRGVAFTEAQTAATSVTVTAMNKPEGATPDPLSVTRALPGALRNDKTISVDVPWSSADLQRAADRMPIKRSLPEYVAAISLAFDARLDFSAPPTRAEVWLDGRRYDAAVISVKHTITAQPARWDVSLACAPVHLLTRESDA